ncbi:hypothetical protein NGM10_00900 [Halorussus salilacus]|uniref:hypothetical protein n=1 Tax=Halorussus salilacus TaxID=2953750 RepID=UPI00209FA35D|nr:hypothetical protein [Halorussus salilacus]USZ68314.1 hypothetical protein NGM10_00900 [Halorussus salilacus]
MPIDIEAVVSEGYERTVARNGLVFVGLFYVLSLLDGLLSPVPAGQSALPDPMGGPGTGPVPAEGMQPYAPSLGLSPVVASLLSLLLAVVSIAVVLAAIRTFVSDETDEIPRENFRHNLLWAGLNLLVGGIVFGILVTIGFVFLVVPGLFLLVSLFFWQIYVAVEDQNFVEGFQSSWGLTDGNRLRLFGLGILVVAIAIVVSIGFGLPGIVLPDIPSYLIAELGSAFITVFFVATAARTYEQLVAMEAEPRAETYEEGV